VVKILADDWHVLTGSYALDALPDPERVEFERHLQHCPSCEAEVRGLRETAARLAMAQALQPPPGMQQRVLAAAYRTRQLPPLRSDRLRAARDHRRAQIARRFAPRRIAAFAAAASVAAAVALGITQVSTQHRLESARASNAAISRVVTAPDARIETTRTSAGGSVTVVASAALREAVVTGTGTPPAGRVYQVWVMSPSGARSAGLMAGPSTVLASAVVPGDRIGITVEPAGGTSKPTTTPVAVLPA
jgi:Anti-sigma-K factor rskA, C-terminal/Anti-sigma-K factor RskA, N-terminal domain